MATKIQARMADDAIQFWDQTQDWIMVMQFRLEDSMSSHNSRYEFAGLSDFLKVLAKCRAPTEAHVDRLRGFYLKINPRPSPQLLASCGSADFEEKLNLLVAQQGACQEVLAMRRAVLSYSFSSFIFEGMVNLVNRN